MYLRVASKTKINSNNYCAASSTSSYQSPSPASLEWMASDSRTSSITYTDMDTMQSQSFKNNKFLVFKLFFFILVLNYFKKSNNLFFKNEHKLFFL